MGDGAVAENKVEIIITGDPSGAKAALKSVEQQSRQLGDTFKEIGKLMLGFAGGMALFEGIKRAISGTAAAGLQVNAQLEQAMIQFKVLTGSAKEAQKIVSYLYDYAAKTPFEFQGVLQAASVIKGAKLDMEKWIPVIGNMASAGQAVGLTMDQVAMSIARVRSGNVGEFFERVGAYLGITREDLQRYGIEWDAAGALADRSGAGIQRVLEAIYEESSTRFKNMAEEQSNTFSGMWSTIKDTFSMIQAEVMKPFFENLKQNVMPAMRELSDRFLEAYKTGGLLAGLKMIIPPELANYADRVAQAWNSVAEAGQRLWMAIRPLATQIGQLAAVTFGGMALAAAELAKALADLISKVMQIPGAALAVQALAAGFLAFRVIIPLVTGLGKVLSGSLLGPLVTGIRVAIGWISAFAEGIGMLWAMAAARGVSAIGRIILILRTLGVALMTSVGFWVAVSGAAIAAGALIVRNWQKVVPFFAACGKMISAVMILAKNSVIVAFEEMRFGAIASTRGLVAGVASGFAKLIESILPLAGKILPDTWLEPLHKAGEMAKGLASGQVAAISAVGSQLAAAKGQIGKAAADLSLAWQQIKETGSAAWGAVKTDVLSMTKLVSGKFKDMGNTTEDAADQGTKAGQQLNEGLGGGAEKAAGKAGKLEDALKKLQQTASTVADTVMSAFREVGRVIGEGPNAAGELTKQIKLAMIDVENYIIAGGKQSGQVIQDSLQTILNMIPWAVQEIGPKTTVLLQKLSQAAAMLIQLPMEEAKKRGIEIAAVINELWAEVRNKVRDYAYDAMQHISTLGGMTVRQQADYLRQLLSMYEWNTKERWRLEEELYRKNMEILDDQIEAVKKAYEDRLGIVDEETKKEVEILEGRLKALDEKDKLSDREKTRQEHEKKLTELIRKRKYHELRTGKEHADAIADIDKQMAEEEQRWQEQQHDWNIDDQKEQIREEIDLAKERGEERKKALKQEFDDTIKLYEKQFKELSARIGIWEPEYLDKFNEIGKKAIEALVAGGTENLPLLKALRQEIEALIPGMESAAGAHTPAPSPGTPGGGGTQVPQTKMIYKDQDYEIINNRAAMKTRALAGLLGLPEPTWENGQVDIGGKKFSPLKT